MKYLKVNIVFNTALLLWALSPVFEKNDFIFYATSLLSVALAFFWIGVMTVSAVKHKDTVLDRILGNTANDIYTIVILLCGSLVQYIQGTRPMLYLWSTLLVVAVINFFWRVKR